MKKKDKKNTAKLWIISALVDSNWSQVTFFILAKVLTPILAQFSPRKHSSATRRHLAIVEPRLKSRKRRTAENYSSSIVTLLTWNRLHFPWSYWHLKILLLPYICDGIIGYCSNSIHKKWVCSSCVSAYDYLFVIDVFTCAYAYACACAYAFVKTSLERTVQASI